METANSPPMDPESKLPPTLDTLNDHVLSSIISFLDTAKSVSTLSRTCKKLHLLIETDGWRAFVKTKFLSLNIPTDTGQPWRILARSLYWQTRCWERRSIVLDSVRHSQHPNDHQQRRQLQHGTQTVPFRPVLAAHLDHQNGLELLVCGAGENIEARWRGRTKEPGEPVETVQRHHPGSKNEYVSGRDDITSIGLLDHQNSGVCVVTGRASGHLELLSGSRDSFGHKLGHLDIPDPPQRTSRDSDIRSLDVCSQKGYIVANTRRQLMFYRVPEELQVGSEEPPHIQPATTIVGPSSGNHARDSIRATKFLSRDLVVVGRRKSLMHVAVTPRGLENQVAVTNTSLDPAKHDSSSASSLRALEAVGPGTHAGGHMNLVLSSWDNGAIRLQDPRTPTPFDTTYRDSFDPYGAMISLLSYGTERFLGGNVEGWLKVFDFRWPKPYYHTNELPCSTHQPFPPPMNRALNLEDNYTFPCDHTSGKSCRWHSESRHNYYRPDCSIGLGKIPGRSQRERVMPVWSLAKASNLSPTFYVGLAGNVIEGNLYSHHNETGDPLFGFWKPQKNMPKEESMFMECWDYSPSVPRMGSSARVFKSQPPGTESPFGPLAKWHRLDQRYHCDRDYHRLVSRTTAAMGALGI